MAVLGLLPEPRSLFACDIAHLTADSACGAAEVQESNQRWRAGFGFTYTSTVLRFPNAMRIGEVRGDWTAEVAYVPTARLTLSAGLGIVVAGRLLAPNGSHAFTPGVLSSVGASYRLVQASTRVGDAFAIVSGLASFANASTEASAVAPRDEYEAFDVRLGVAAGLTWRRSINAYVLARAFTGPVAWRYQGALNIGIDSHEYQLGAGCTVLVLRRLGVFVEGVPLGEQAVSGGGWLAF